MLQKPLRRKRLLSCINTFDFVSPEPSRGHKMYQQNRSGDTCSMKK